MNLQGNNRANVLHSGNNFVDFEVKGKIIRGKFYCFTYWNLKKAHETIRLMRDMRSKVSLPLLLDVRKVIGMNKKARQVMSSNNTMECISACALLVDSTFSSVIWHLYIELNKPEKPFKIFKSQRNALKWLKSFNEKPLKINTTQKASGITLRKNKVTQKLAYHE